jgi:hypothetical protein
MVVVFSTTYAINAFHHLSCDFESCWWQGLLDATLCDKICQWLTAGRWFSPGTRFPRPLKVALNTITPLHINANSRWPNARLPEGSPRDSETRLTLVTCYNKQIGTVLKTDVKMLKRWQSWHMHSSAFIIVRLNKDKNRFSLIWYLTGTSCYHVKAAVSSIKY